MEKKHIEKKKENQETKEFKPKSPEKWRNRTDDPSIRAKLRGFDLYEASQYKYETDKENRIRRASGVLRLDKTQERNNTDQKLAGGKDRRADDQGGHYIARMFGGSPDLNNLFAQNGHFNQGAYKKMEKHWESYVKQTDKDGKPLYQVEVDIRPTYKKGSERPDKLFVYSKVTDQQGKTVEKKLYMFKNEYDSNRKERAFSEGSA